MTEHVFVNGRLVPATRARISVFDRGLLYGDGLFETLRAYQGKPFGLSFHLERLTASAHALGIPPPNVDWRRAIGRLLERNGLDRCDAWVRLMVTRGTGAPVLLPPAGLVPTTIILARPVDPALARAQRAGVKAVLLPFARDASLAVHKGLNYASAILGKQIAQARGAHEGIYTHRGHLLEGATSTLFLLREQTLCTPRIAGILPGVTRRFVLDLARQAGLQARERNLTVADLDAADEAFLTGSVSEIVPIVEVDGRRIGSGKPGPVTRGLQRAYRRLVRAGDAG